MKSITIVGAGIAGLTAALVLCRHGHAITILEKRATITPEGAGIVLAPNAVRILQQLGVDLSAYGNRLKRITVRSAEGATLQAIDLNRLMGSENAALSFQRAELHQALLAALPKDIPVHLGCPPVDCSAFDSDITIGADGIHSTVREQTLGEIPLRYSGQACWLGIIPNPGIEDGFEAWGGSARIGVAPLSRGRLYVFLVLSAPQDARRQTTIGAIKDSFSHFTDPVPMILNALEGTELLHLDMEELPSPYWGRENVVLIGDAAHAMTPNLGQGAASAIEDAAFLPVVIEAPSPARKMESLRHARISHLQKSSRQFGEIAHWRSPIAVSLRNALMRATPDRINDRFYMRIIEPGLSLMAELQAQ